MDKVRPTIIATYPHNCEKCVSIYRTIKVLFHEEIFPAQEYDDIKITDVKGTKISIETYICGNKLFIDVCGALKYDTKYYVVIPRDSVKDSDCNLFCPEYVFEFTTEKNENLLYITRTEPKNEAKCVDIDPIITINFNKIVIEGCSFDDIVLESDDDTPVKIKKLICGSALKIDVCEELQYDTEYELFIPKDAVKDLDDVTLLKDYELEFTTEKEKLLYVVCTIPKDGQVDVDLCENIVVEFNTEIEEGCDYCKIELYDKHGKCIDIEKCIKGNKLFIEAEKLCACMKYTLVIPKNAVQTCEGITMKCDFNMSFYTVCCK